MSYLSMQHQPQLICTHQVAFFFCTSNQRQSSLLTTHYHDRRVALLNFIASLIHHCSDPIICLFALEPKLRLMRFSWMQTPPALKPCSYEYLSLHFLALGAMEVSAMLIKGQSSSSSSSTSNRCFLFGIVRSLCDTWTMTWPSGRDEPRFK